MSRAKAIEEFKEIYGITFGLKPKHRWVICRDDERYQFPDLEKEYPESGKVTVEGTIEQARFVAEALSIYKLAGCDYFYYVEDDPDL